MLDYKKELNDHLIYVKNKIDKLSNYIDENIDCYALRTCYDYNCIIQFEISNLKANIEGLLRRINDER